MGTKAKVFLLVLMVVLVGLIFAWDKLSPPATPKDKGTDIASVSGGGTTAPGGDPFSSFGTGGGLDTTPGTTGTTPPPPTGMDDPLRTTGTPPGGDLTGTRPPPPTGGFSTTTGTDLGTSKPPKTGGLFDTPKPPDTGTGAVAGKTGDLASKKSGDLASKKSGDLTSKKSGDLTSKKSGDTTGKTPGGRTTAFDTSTSSFNSNPIGTTTPPLSTAGGKTHKVVEGDTLWTIAEEYYKNGTKWKLIEEANKDKLGTSNFLKKGMELVIPDLPAAAPAHVKETPGAEKETVGPGEYKIKSGDTLSSIAKDQFGSEHLWEEIDKANKDKPGWNTNMLKVGTVIRIPPKPEKAEKRDIAPKTDRKPELKEEAVPPEFAGKRTYRIKSGDKLWSIAEKELGSGMKYEKILEANKGRIDPNNLKVGQLIVLPEDSSAPAPR